jgi:alkylated DNA repair dioxygenase AlkB
MDEPHRWETTGTDREEVEKVLSAVREPKLVLLPATPATAEPDEIADLLALFGTEPPASDPTASAAPAGALPDTAPLREAEALPGLIGGALVYYRPGFLGRAADHFFQAFAPGGPAGIPWVRRTITLFGRECREARDTAFFGDPGTHYRYSGKDHTPHPWAADPTGALAELLEFARRAGGVQYNFCLMNLYAPADGIGAHSDDERDLAPGSSIFSVSLGRARVFSMEAKGGAGARGGAVRLRLAHGSALVMAGPTQQAYKHRVDPEKTPRAQSGELSEPAIRVNLTFRRTVR